MALPVLRFTNVAFTSTNSAFLVNCSSLLQLNSDCYIVRFFKVFFLKGVYRLYIFLPRQRWLRRRSHREACPFTPLSGCHVLAPVPLRGGGLIVPQYVFYHGRLHLT